MSTQITTAFVKQYRATVFHLSQQKGSRFRDRVRLESQKGESEFFERIGAVTAVVRTTRHSDTPQIDTPHSRRRVTLRDYEWADLIDKPDRLRLLIDPTSDYAKAGMNGMFRAMDDLIIEKALDDAQGGKEGSTAVSLPDTQKLVCSDGSETAGVNLNVATLRRGKKRLDEEEVDEAETRYWAAAASQFESLLSETEVTSSDFNTVKALVQGEVNTFMGFQFIRTQRLSATSASTTFELADGTVGSGGGTAVSGARRNIVWAKMGLLLSLAQDIITRVDERADKSYSTQVFLSQGIGSTRMEEVKVVEVLCVE